MKRFVQLIFLAGFPTWALAQNVGVDVATPQQKLDVAGALKIGNTTTGAAGSLRWNGTEFQFHDGTQWITLNANTDDQVLDVIQLNGNDLEISIESDGQATHTIDLSSFLDNTDNQTFDQVSINGSNQLLLSLEDDGQATHVLDLSGYLDNTDNQTFDIVQLSGSNLELSLEDDGLGTHVIDLSSFLDNTDDQTLDVAQLTGNNLELSLEDDGQATHSIDLSGFLDNTDDQTFDVINITSDELRLSLEADGQATHVLDLAPYKDNTDDQQFDVVQLSGNTLQLSLEDDGQATHSIDLSGFADNTDDQVIDVLSLSGNTLNISLEDDGQANQTLDLSQFLDNTDNQQLNGFSISGNILSLNIEDAGGIQTVNLAPYLDNTDNQEITQFNLSGNTLQLTLEDDAGGQETVDLSGYLDNTDDQQVSTFTLSGTDLQLQVEDDAGGLQTVDLDPLRRLLTDDDGDTKVEVEATADEDQIRFTTDGGEAMRINTTQQVGIGLSTGIQNKLVVNGTASDTRSVLGLRGGNAQNSFSDGAQIAFGYDGDDSYQHFIHTRHNSSGGSTNNAIDFYVTDGTQYNTVTSGSTHVMSLNSGNVGVGTTAPDRKLDVQGGGIRVSGLSSANLLVISDADGDLVNLSSLAGTGMGDNLGNHTATTTLNMTDNAIDNAAMVDITAGNGNGIRFWGSNSYKISMGNSNDYRYGDVQEYSIKMNMNNDAQGDRGWTWGVDGQTPVASISNGGHMTLNGSMFFDCVNCGSTSDPYPLGGSSWGDMVIQGRVLSANANIHLSPPGGSNVIIDDAYRSAGGSTSGSAGLQVERLAGGGNRIVMADNSGVLYPLANLNGSGLGDNLGNHTATTTIVTNGNDIDFVRGDLGQIRSVGAISFDWTSGSYDTSPNHGIESKNESGSFGDELRINSFNDIVHTIDANNNDATSVFKVQHHSTANGSDLFQINSPDGRMWFGRGDGSNRMYLDDNGIYLYNGWFRNHGGTGLYNQSYGNHWYATDANYWISRSNRGIVLRNVGNTTRGYLYHNDGDEFGLLDRDGNWAVRTVRDQYVELRDNDEAMFRAGAGGVGGNYGSVVTYGGGKGSWEGYSINDRYVFMSADASTMGLYNDVDNRWVMYHVRNDRTDFYEPDGGAVSFRVDNNENQFFRDLRAYDNDIWDVNNLTVNTIYSEDANGTGSDVVNIIDRLRVDLPSGQDFYVSNDDGRTTLRTQSWNHGQIGRLQNYWYRSYVRYNYRLWEGGFSDERVKENIRDLDSNESLDKIMQLRGKKFDLSKDHPLVANGEIQNETDRILMKDNIGFIAQELQKVVPEMVIKDEESGYLIVMNYEQLFPIVIEAMQEQQRQIEELKGENNRMKPESQELIELRNEVEDLKGLVNRLLEDK